MAPSAESALSRLTRSDDCRDRYAAIRQDCVLVAACDAKHAPYLLNALASLGQVYPDRPLLVVYDIGLSWLQRRELEAWPEVTVRPVPPFVPHWRLNWSWKLHALTHPDQRFVLYLDLANLVILRSLAPWFLAIQRHGYLVVANGQVLDEITPSDYWAVHHLGRADMAHLPTFGAGIIGFDRHGPAAEAVRRALGAVCKGLNLGRSATEPTPKYRPDIIRDCACFRADQTVLNLAFRQVFGRQLQVRRAARYAGSGGPADHPAQYVWYARRTTASLIYLYRRAHMSAGGWAWRLNRSWWRVKLAGVAWVKRMGWR